MNNPFYNLQELFLKRDFNSIGSSFVVFITHALLQLKNNPGAGANIILNDVEYSLLLVPKVK